MGGQDGALSETTIRAGAAPCWPDLRELWRYRDLLRTFALRGVLVRYRQAVLGIAWAVLRPLLTAVILAVVFGLVARFGEGGKTPYLLLTMSGALAYQLFSSCLLSCSGSVVGNAGMVGKIYFPRLILPLSACLVAAVDFLFALLVFGLLMLAFGVMPPARACLFPVFALLALLAALGPGLWLAALNVRYRDVGHIVPFLVQILTYISPVGFASEKIPEAWRFWYSLNPLVGAIDGLRWSVLPEAAAPDWTMLGVSAGAAVLLLASGIAFFRRSEEDFADII